MTGWDWWRTINAVGAFIAFIIAGYWTWFQWGKLIASERVRWLSFIFLLMNIAYAPMEVVFWPQYQFRVPMVTIAIAWALISLSLRPRFPRENRYGGQSRLPRSRT